ncbi:xanthine dehydrogenase molybdopterin binding subunit [Mangrovimicrobium sediminis]|uniref:Xanthine dehydrogenase molybdopterin binding subunit n=1 Tax=Mangrovimicrobium sediminis TaxID=2562682 RepID=A0A4Z0M540_9GAMM|nr:xanthine dehydrogenase molybdopterin binding subunit [Haliea sp. SAOS-164]TGD74619.1 xanthine dehydrogenase molybdopterin binding subunit [Haliea sp. SAOS-164]
MRKLTPAYNPNAPAVDPVGKSLPQDSAARHVAGSAVYVDDMPAYPDQLHVAVGVSSHAHARVLGMALDAVRAAPGVVDVVVQADIPGSADISPVFDGDLLLAGDTVHYVGQPLFAVAATSLEAAQRAVQLAQVDYEPLVPRLEVTESLAAEDFLLPTRRSRLGDPEAALAAAAMTLSGEMAVGGQEHFYLEGQVALAVPDEVGVQIYSSSQHPAEVQKLAAEVLDLPLHAVTVQVRRMGGGFGGKESQPAALACLAALFARRTGRSVRYRMPRWADMVQTGKRHPFWNRYTVGFDESGVIQALVMDVAGNCGCTADLSDGIVDRAANHADNAYFLKNAAVTGYRCRTNMVSHTAFRGFGAPQGIVTTEAFMDDIARRVGMDPLDVRKANLYRPGDSTPYGQEIEESVLVDLVAELEHSCDYRARRAAVAAFNAQGGTLRRGLSLVPVKFGISFTTTHLNQAGALVHIYTDGSVHVSHGGTEMGQGLYIKVAQVVARALGVSIERVMPGATCTDKVPNASPTAASAGTDMNGMAALDACNRIRKRLVSFAAQHFGCDEGAVELRDDHVFAGEQVVPFPDFISLAYLNRVSLSSTGFYRTPKIHFNRETGQGRPFFYFANGAACSEVVVDTSTGEYRVTRVDVLHDVGASLNPAIDIGQIEGGFVQGMGWLTTEELSWNDDGVITSNSPANYKIPTAADVPEHFDVRLFQRPNAEDTVYHSKAVGEPPLMLPISVWCALRDACASLCDYRFNPRMDPPATPERVYWAAREALRG